ncbi:trans-1,2-dihydrobenzene-1,2-diol dehydrogenase-like [Rhipicephalus microplus]|uniref:trans-1,2-dihydrobenzene-1,2-diol dehydrogenase-like n=1 Tax=Rhipicephalus microplus TaxID=6941 RepID=UPI003F6C6313
MQALWSRYLPTYNHMEELPKKGTIEEVRYVHFTFGYTMEHQPRMFMKELGGSVLLTLGNYCVNIVLQVFGGERPVKISACGDLSPQGTDQGVAVSMEFSGGRLAMFTLSGVVKLPGVAEVFGRKGKITIHPPFHAPTCVE